MSEFIFFEGSCSEEALLRSALVYNSVRKQVSREDLLEKAIYAVLHMSSSPINIDEVDMGVFQYYHYKLDPDSTKSKIDELKKKGLISHNNYEGIRAIKGEGIESTLNSIERESYNLVAAIYNKAEEIYHRQIPNKQIVKSYIRKSLMHYLRDTYLELFELQKKTSHEEKEDVIKETMKGLGNEIGESTIRALSDILIHPSAEQQKVILQWSKAFLTLQLMNLDPALNEFKETKLKKKSFVIDTDVALHCLCENTRYSNSYNMMIKRLRRIGCDLYLPKQIIQEVGDHIDAALKWASSYGEQLLELPDETLESGHISNVFIEDYVKTIRKQKLAGEKCIPFNAYLRNLGDNHHNSSLLMQNLCTVFGENNIKRVFAIPENIDAQVKELMDAIHEKTLLTPKSWNRSDEGNLEISRTDAILYATVKRMNEEIDSSDFFANKAYILTSSSRTRRCAMEIDGYERKIICHPQSLYAMLDEIGKIDTDSNQLVEMLNNPYMAHVAEQLWKQIEPILQQNQAISFKTINALKNDVNLRIDELLTSQSTDETIHILRKFGDDSLFGKDVLELQKRLENEKAKNEELLKENEYLKNALVKKQNRGKHYQDKIKQNQKVRKYLILI